LLHEEQYWRLKIRAIWIKEGDKKSSFFHRYASHRKNVNTIWSLSHDNGYTHCSLPELKRKMVNFFKGIYDNPEGEDIVAKLQSLKHMPRYFTEEESDEVSKAVSRVELEKVINEMPKDKSLGPDGWTQEFFSAFFELVNDDLLRVIEESRINGRAEGSLNSTFVSLIPNESSPSSLSNYRPISLCNFVYKVISKIIENQIKGKLGECISSE